jgi:hypothetical protein
MRMKKTLAGFGILMMLATAGTGCGSRKAVEEASSRASAAATRAEQAASAAQSSVSRAEQACSHCRK